MNSRAVIAVISGLLLVGLLCVGSIAGLVFVARSGVLPSSAGNDSRLQPVIAVSPESGTDALNPQPTNNNPPLTVDVPDDALAILRAEESVLNQIYTVVGPSVVNISTSGTADSPVSDLGEGSGFIWDTEGHIVTNNHVVEGAESILVTFSNNVQVPAEIVGRDEDADLAVLKVETDIELLRPVAVAPSADLRVGQRVIAIGNPFGFDQTLTVGVISALARAVPGAVSPLGGFGFSIPNLVQTDAAINPGNSGGPLLDIEGRVIGVNTLIYTNTPNANSGVGFAIPADKVSAVVPSLIAQGFYETPYLGIVSTGNLVINAELAELLELEGVTFGVLVSDVAAGGPSDRAGVRGAQRQIDVPALGGLIPTGGDVIIAIDDVAVQTFDNLINYLDTRTVGDVVTLTVIREGEELALPITLAARPDQSP